MKAKENVGTVSILVDRDTPLDLLGLGENVEIRERFVLTAALEDDVILLDLLGLGKDVEITAALVGVFIVPVVSLTDIRSTLIS